MDNREMIQKTMNYIDDNIKAEISAAELADIAGFSLYHFYRLFQLAVGMPLMQYVLRRKLLYGIYDISNGMSKTDAALLYGFETYAGFYKAFRREIGYTPSEFLRSFKAKKPYAIDLFKEEYIMITHNKISAILKHWDMQNEAIRNVYIASTGECNDNAYYIGEKYVLKVTPNLGELKKHISLSRAISHCGLCVAEPVQTTDGNDYVADGELYFCLSERLDGELIAPADMYQEDKASHARFIGEMIGQLHLALSRVDAVINEADIYSAVTGWAMPKLKERISLPEGLEEKYTTVFGALFNKIPKQIIHRDPNPSNIITCGGKCGFIDFDLAERNVRIFDPCYAATAILSESFAENDEEKLIKWVGVLKEIITGYDSVVKMTAEEFEAVPYVILSNQLIATAWFSEQDRYRDVFETNMKMTRWIADNISRLRFD